MRRLFLLFFAACGTSGTPAVTTLYEGEARALAVRDGAVYFIDGGLMRLDPMTQETSAVITGEDIAELQSGGGGLVIRQGTTVEHVEGSVRNMLATDVSSFVATEASLFYVAGFTLYERRYVAGAVASTVAGDVPGALIAADSQGFVAYDGNALFTRSNSGGAWAQRFSGGTNAVIGGGKVVFSATNGVFAMPRFEGEATLVAQPAGDIVSVRDGVVYYRTGVKLMRAPLAGGEAEALGELSESAKYVRAGDTIYGFNASRIFSFKLP